MDHLRLPGNRDGIHESLDRAYRVASRRELYPETLAVLEQLRARGYRLGVISNHTDALPGLLAHLRISEFFQTVTYSQAAGAEKPDPRIFRMALGHDGCRPGEALHVGDSWEADVLGAREVGMAAIWLDRGERAPDREGPRVVTLDGVLEVVTASGAPQASDSTMES
jgi:putative hydrolase of the HAD superfamily